jgi:hypothetical protein
VGFGQIFPGSNPASEVDEHSRLAVNKIENKAAGAAAIRRLAPPGVRPVLTGNPICNLVFKLIYPVYRQEGLPGVTRQPFLLFNHR